MRTVVFFIVVISIFTGLGFGARALIKIVNRKLWNWRSVDVFARWLPYSVLLFMLLAVIGGVLNLRFFMFAGLMAMAVTGIASLLLILSLPVSLIMIKFGELAERLKKSGEQRDIATVAGSRRRFLKTAAAAIPVFTLTTAGSGFARAFGDVRIPQITFHYHNLPAELNGFRILHLSDLHLGYYYTLANFEELLQKLQQFPVDLVLVTGDIADDLNQLPDALRMIDQIPSAYPKFVSLGNHEYYRGLEKVLRIIDAGPLPLLRDSGAELKIKNTSFFVGGADDPMVMHSNIDRFMHKTIESSVRDADPQDFKILMSHRPRALDVAGEYGIDLVLAGHTHGGQIGMNGRSVFEGIMKERYLWGEYLKGKTRLYTSSGVGHWFPYRLGCPAEAPIITLKRG